MKLAERAANLNMERLENSTISIDGEDPVDIKDFIASTIDNMVIGRLDAYDIEAAEGSSKNPTEIEVAIYPTDEYTAAGSVYFENGKFLTRKEKPDDIPTIIIPTTWEKSGNIFNYVAQTPLGSILRTSTLAKAYTNVKDTWVRLNSNEEGGTNICLFKDVIVFMTESGNFLKRPFKINVMIISFPDYENMLKWGRDKALTWNMEDESEVFSLMDCAIIGLAMIHDIVKAAIVTNSRAISINPYTLSDIIGRDKDGCIYDESDAIHDFMERLGEEDAKKALNKVVVSTDGANDYDSAYRYEIASHLFTNCKPAEKIADIYLF